MKGGWVWAPDQVWGDGKGGVRRDGWVAAVGAAHGEIPAASAGMTDLGPGVTESERVWRD